jgi:hypothetical protein
MPPISVATRLLGLSAATAGMVITKNNLDGAAVWHAAAHDQNNSASMMNEALYNQTNFSGNALFDDLSVPVNNAHVNLGSWFWDRRMEQEYIFRDVIGANLPWLALAGAGLWLGARDALAGAGRQAVRTLGLPLVTLGRGLARTLNRPGLLSAGATQLRRGLVASSRLAVANLPATLLAGVATWFAFDKLSKTADGSAQQDYFRSAFIDGARGSSSTYSFNPY